MKYTMRNTMKNFVSVCLVSAAALTFSYAQTSPNGKIQIEYQDSALNITYLHQDRPRQVASVRVVLDGEPGAQSAVKQVDYTMPTGKRSHCTNAYRERLYPLAGGATLCVRAWDDGVTWGSDSRDVPGLQPGRPHLVDFSAARHDWLMQWSDSYEGFYPRDRNHKAGQRLGYPALFEYENGFYALLSESRLDSMSAASSYYMTDRDEVFEVKADGEGVHGDQTLIIGSLADVVASTLVNDNSLPCRIEDATWIQPGVAAWVYWAYNHGSNDYDIIKRYTDMARDMHLPYVLIDAEWDDAKPMMVDGVSVPMVEAAVRYATQCGVRPMIWYNSSVGWVNGAPGPKFRLNKPEDREREFAWCERIGVKGVKIDFFSGDNNRNIRYMVELLECAARHHLLVNFHGATVPRGLQRTYPNLISVEGVYGAEWYNNVPTFTSRAAAHNATLPFTRNVIGSMDYTPCAFTDSQHPHITTHGHELALTVLYESGIQHLADRPESFLYQPEVVQQFLSELPTAWDDVRFLSGYPGRNVVLARRRGQRWYVAGINGTDEAMLFPLAELLAQLPVQQGKVMLLTDSSIDDRPWRVERFSLDETYTTLLCGARGGFVLTLDF